MAELIAKSPLAGQGPVEHAGLRLAEALVGPVTSVAPYAGQSAALKKTLGMGFPASNSVERRGEARLVWTGRDQAFLIGAAPPDLAGLAAVSDQSDGWAALSLTGAGAADVLARLVPVDLRGFEGCARTLLGHMNAIVIAQSDGFELLVFRSMARTAWHEVETAMKMRAARLAHGC